MLSLKNVSFSYDQKVILKNINLEIKSGEIISLLGPSGSGKSTLLNLISGLATPSSGEIFHNDIQVLAPSHSRVIIFQDHQLFPWKTAIENIEFALKAQNKITNTAINFLAMVKMQDFAHLYPHQLSGGMKQRVGIARAIAADPDILLLDEPFASLDPFIRHEIAGEIMSLVKELKKTVILVTHNIEEALFVGEKVCLFSTRPATILEEMKIEIKKTKHLIDIKKDPRYFEYESYIYKYFSSLKDLKREESL
ncbi:MAG: ABC transporter ATP-binding protein [Bacteriovorax sp.]|nr:ABC transporter ATP-binding protein [Bacteriovorax sp.]